MVPVADRESLVGRFLAWPSGCGKAASGGWSRESQGAGGAAEGQGGGSPSRPCVSDLLKARSGSEAVGSQDPTYRMLSFRDPRVAGTRSYNRNIDRSSFTYSCPHPRKDVPEAGFARRGTSGYTQVGRAGFWRTSDEAWGPDSPGAPTA